MHENDSVKMGPGIFHNIEYGSLFGDSTFLLLYILPRLNGSRFAYLKLNLIIFALGGIFEGCAHI